jgi:putative ABC transport system permease protein
MIKNYLKVAWRNLLKNKWYSAINIIGLATGMAVALLIGLWIYDELSYNKAHKNYDRLAQVMTTQTFNGNTGTGPAVSIPLGIELRTKYTSDFKYVSLASWNFEHVLQVGDKQIAKAGMWVQPEFPTMFSLKMLKGKPDALKDPSTILLAASTAKALFGDEDPMNKTVRFDSKIDLQVGGVYQDLPHNSSFRETLLLAAWDKYVDTEPWLKEADQQWGNHSFQLFVQLHDKIDADKATNKIKDRSSDGEVAPLQRFQKRKKCWRTYRLRMVVRDHRNICIAACVYQFHEPLDRAQRKTCERSRHQKNRWLIAPATDRAIPERINTRKSVCTARVVDPSRVASAVL